MFDASHINPMGWDEFHALVRQLIKQLAAQQQQQGQAFAAVAPILRSGGLPAVMIANALRIIPMLPLQVKTAAGASQSDAAQLVLPPVVTPLLTPDAPHHLLIVECNTHTGQSARLAQQALRAIYPQAHLHYACVTKVFGGPPQIDGYDSYHAACLTNEAFRADAPATARAGITVFPWENPADELEEINGPAAV